MLAQAAASRAPAFLPSGLRRRNAAPRPLRRSTAARSSSDAQPASQPDPQPALRLRGGAAELPPPPENFTVTIHYKETVEVPAGLDWHDEGCDLHSYMMLPVDQHPPGARRRQRHPLHPHHQQDTGAHPPIKTAPSSPSSPTHLLTPSKPPNHIRSYPLAQFFWLEVRPVVQCEVLVLPDTAPCGQGPCVSIRCNSARVEGAWAESNGLNDRFLFSGETRLVWGGKGGAAKGGKGAIVSVNDIIARVDPPPPFSSIPAGVLESVGNAVVAAVAAKLQEVFVGALAADYARWATDRESRELREKLADERRRKVPSGAAVL